jgi:hypothetical protein
MVPVNSVAHSEPMLRGCALAQNEPEANQTSPSDFFLHLLHRVGYNFSTCATLYALLAKQADLGFVKASRRELCCAMGQSVSHAQVSRALQSLEAIGLVDCKTHPNTTTRYRVNGVALRALMATPLPEMKITPGLSALPALERIFSAAETTLATNEEGLNDE